MPYCMDCKQSKQEKHRTGFGDFPAICKHYGIGINPDWDSCPKIDPIDPNLEDRGKMPERKNTGGIKESEFFE